MLKAMLSVWDKKGEKYSFANVDVRVKQSLLSVLPSGVTMASSNISSVDTKISFGN